MTDTRYSAEDLRKMAESTVLWRTVIYTEAGPLVVCSMLKQAAADAETLAGIRAWLEARLVRDGRAEVAPYDFSEFDAADATLSELDRLSRGDA